jgi:uncharacterized phage protein gp47/JayE
MNYQIDGSGIHIPTLEQLIEQKSQQFRDIYGQDINLNQNSPDGQFINIEAQAEADLGEFLVGIYNSFDPDSALGRELDRVAAYKGLQRKGASYTRLNLTLTADRPLVLRAGFLVGDSLGNNFELENDLAVESPGSVEAIFRSVVAGEVTVGLQTVTNIVTPMLGITGVINSSSPVESGVDEESDIVLRTRFSSSVALNGTGHLDNLYTRLLNIPDVTSCYIDENRSGETNGHGTPGHSIWVIVNGGGDREIAETIYSTISDGCGMRGDIEVDLEDSRGNLQQIFFDRIVLEDLYVRFTVYGKTPLAVIDQDKIKADLLSAIAIATNMLVDKNYINLLLTTANSNLIYSDIKLSKDNIDWEDMVRNSNLNYQFSLTVDNIEITEI